MDLAETVRQQALTMLGRGPLSHDQLNGVLRYLAKYRARLIHNTLLQAHGPRVIGGPFAGMAFVPESTEGCYTPKLLGCYEHELHPIVEAAVATGYSAIVNIGSAEGYYAVGLARRCPNAHVFAHDDNPTAQAACRELAQRNGVADRVTVAGYFEPAAFHTFAGRQTIFLIDIEGHERELLETVPAAELADFDFVIECHDSLRAGISTLLAARFAKTHTQSRVAHALTAIELPPELTRLGHLDQLLATWEWRSGPTPWLLLGSNRRPATPFGRAVSATAGGS